MSDRALAPNIIDEMYELVTASIRRDISSKQRARLQELVALNIEACDLYLNVVCESSILLTWAKRRDVGSDGSRAAAGDRVHCGQESVESASTTFPAFAQGDGRSQDTPTFPAILPTTFPTTLFDSTLGYSSGWPVAYLTATVITGLWLLGSWLMPVSRPEQIARNHVPPAAERQIAPEPLPKLLGRITGMVDCKSADPDTTSISPDVRLGEKYQLASGLMEITYDTGAKVILQGPVTYSVETNGGYLAVGKLTGKLEKNDKRETINAEMPDRRSSFIVQPSAFVVHTPTATVTDLGTEFGVEVTRDQQTRTHVFQGTIVVRSQEPATSATHAPREIELGEGESASVAPQGTVIRLTGAESRATAKTIDFVRTIPKWTGKVFSYDFEPPALRAGDLLEQDRWVTHYGGGPSLRVGPGTGADCTQVIGGAGEAVSLTYRQFQWTREWLQIRPGMIVTEEFWVYAATPQNMYLLMGAWWAGDSRPGLGVFGINQGKWHIRQAGNGQEADFFGQGGMKANHWYDIKLAIDFSMPGGSATLYHRDVTAGETTFTEDSILRNVEMQVPVVPWAPPAGQYEIMGFCARAGGCSGNRGQFYLDNFCVRIDRNGENKLPEQKGAKPMN